MKRIVLSVMVFAMMLGALSGCFWRGPEGHHGGRGHDRGGDRDGGRGGGHEERR